MTVSSPENQVHLAVAGVGLALRGGAARRVVLRLARYQPFLAAGPPAATIDVTTAEVNQDRSHDPEVNFLSDHAFSFRTHSGEGYLDVSTGTGRLQIGANESTGASALENFLRVAYAVLLVRRGGFLFHSAGMIRNGQGYLFYGHSGSGKSTISRLSQRHATLLSDDLVALQAHEGTWWVYGTPFWGDLDDPQTNASAPLRGLFGLVKDRQVKLEPLSSARAVADVVSSVPVTCKDSQLSARLIDLCTDLVAHVPCYHLHFTLDDSFWGVLDELA